MYHRCGSPVFNVKKTSWSKDSRPKSSSFQDQNRTILKPGAVQQLEKPSQYFVLIKQLGTHQNTPSADFFLSLYLTFISTGFYSLH
ncbi:hypothetical protein XENTR_v10009323 [Xenopus tropicalis]|nr:hypothetical protein XENTR_v10009323 [Xenopus tropicalis]